MELGSHKGIYCMWNIVNLKLKETGIFKVLDKLTFLLYISLVLFT